MDKRMTVLELMDIVLDKGTFESWDEPIDISEHEKSYRLELERAAERSGLDEAVLTGRALIQGRPVALIANEFRFLGGSIGAAAARRITDAVLRATAESLPLLATTSSGGTRMQEGTPAFIYMVKICRALVDHKTAGLPYLVHLRHPTTGGVLASWGSLGHITIAEPGALIGFLGPKVYELLNDNAFPPGVQISEHLVSQGIIDAVVSTEDLPKMVNRTLSLLIDPAVPGQLIRRTEEPTESSSVWESIGKTRRANRPGVSDVLRLAATDTIRLNGTGKGERDSAMVIALTRLDGQPCVVIGQDRRMQSSQTPMGPAALREARRGMHLANELRLPLVSIVDTPGAELSVAAEEGAIAGEIAHCIAAMIAMKVPTVSVLLGEGCGGGALALLPANRVIAAEHSWLAPLPLEGASAIVYGDTRHAPLMAERQKVSSLELRRAGTIDKVVPESPDSESDPSAFASAIVAEVATQIRELLSVNQTP